MQLTVKFPLNPYPVQSEISSLLYQSLNKGIKLCLIQSPTGTGKSYSLLVGLASWLIDNKYKPATKQRKSSTKLPPWIKANNSQEDIFIEGQKKRIQQRLKQIKQSKITQSKLKPKILLKKDEQEQISQNQQSQKKRTIDDKKVIQHSLPKIIFTSRTHSQLTQIIQSFKNLKTDLLSVAIASKKHLCINKQIKSKQNPQLQCNKLLQKQGCKFYSKQSYGQFLKTDIQQTISIGTKHCKCPYYSLKSVLDVADLICVPYASIMSKQVRNKIGIDITNSIVVFDQGHNVVQNQLQSRSIQIQFSQIHSLLSLIQEYVNKFQNMMKSKNRFILTKLLKLLEQFKTLLEKKYKNKANKNHQVQSVHQFLINLQLSQINIIKIKQYVEESHLNHKIYSSEKPLNPYVLLRFIQLFEQIIVYSDEDSKIIYKFNQNIQDTQFKIMVFNTVKLSEIIKQAKMTVFAGGTLSPLDCYQPLLKKYSNVCEEYQHVINQNQCSLYIMDKYKGKQIIFTHNTKQSKQTFQMIEDIISKSLQITKQGIVIFVQSYKYLQKIRQYIYQHSKSKNICVFDSLTNTKVFSLYQSKITKGEPTILFSVMGGKLSQGINFSDKLARLLIVFGLPYPDTRTPQMQLKMCFNQKQYIDNITMKSVNQTIGRAIRHKNDYANIILVDQRFNRLKIKLPKWMRNRVSNINKIDELIKK